MNKGKRLVAVLLVGAFVAGSAVPVYATSIDERQQKAKELEQQKDKAESQASSLSAQLNDIIADMKKTEEELVAKEAEIAATEDELMEARSKEYNQYENMKTRIKYMYENGNTKFIEILVASESMADFINKAEYINEISTADRELLDEYQRLVKEIEVKEAALKEEKEQLVILQEDLQSKQEEVNVLLANKQAEIADLETEIGENAKELERLIAAAKEAERMRKEQEEANKRRPTGGGADYTPAPPVVSGNGQLSNPCPAARISSEFGPRKSPGGIGSTNHKGRDYAAGVGTPIYASADGRVTTVSYSSVRGNYIKIDHGNGLSTLYQHNSANLVDVGDNVSRGQNIAKVGATGAVTGAHLHYEVHVNGTPVDPRRYL